MNKIKFKSNIGQTIITIFLTVFSLTVLYPFIYCIAYSLSDSTAAAMKQITFFPRGFTFDNYIRVLKMESIYSGFAISVARTLCAVVYAVLVTALASFALSKERFPGKKFFTYFFLIPMYITAGLLPTYVVLIKLGLYNNFWVYVLPHGFYAFNMLLMRTYFQGLPSSLEEAAIIDGAHPMTIFFKIIFPLSMPVIVVVAMHSGVWQWNSWLDAELYISNLDLKPVQSVLQNMIRSSSSQMEGVRASMGQNPITPETIRMTTLVVTVLPIMMIYPFLQKYFVKGVMLGAVKA